jgi:small subunit ribosomal protein S20
VAHHKDAIKRNRQNAKRNAYNRHYRTLMRGTIKKVRALVAKGATEEAAAALPNAVSIIQKVAGKGVIHKKQAARRVSRLAKALQAATKA